MDTKSRQIYSMKEEKNYPGLASREVKYCGNWLQITQLSYYDSKGNRHNWECAERVNSHGAAVIIPLIPSSNEIILVRQYRPPANCFVIEFPAGLIDEGEDAVETAQRELLEETGYHGTVVSVENGYYPSPGASSEQMALVTMTIDEQYHEINPPQPSPDGNEELETLRVKLSSLKDFLKTAAQRGDVIDAKLASFALAMQITGKIS